MLCSCIIQAPTPTSIVVDKHELVILIALSVGSALFDAGSLYEYFSLFEIKLNCPSIEEYLQMHLQVTTI